MTRNTTPQKRQPTLEPLDEQVDHARGSPAGRLILEYTPTLFIDGVVHRGGYDTASLIEALAR
jgi:hypothetical protein